MIRVLISGLAFVATVATAAPVAQFEGGGRKIVLYDDPCEFRNRVVNLPFRVEWIEGGKSFAGCWSSNRLGIVSMWFEDLTVLGLPVEAFVPARMI